MKMMVVAIVVAVAALAWPAKTFATDRCVPGACEAARDADRRAPYTGAKRKTTRSMVCLSVVAHRPTPLVLAQGTHYGATLDTAPALLSWRRQAAYWQPWSRNPTYSIREICLPAKLAQQYVRHGLTLCGGTSPRDPDGRSVWRSHHVRTLVAHRRIGAQNPACLLGRTVCARYGL